MNSEKGFTFIELLIVAFIVLLLVTIYWQMFMEGETDRDDLMSVATESDAVTAVLERVNAQVDSVVPLENQERIEMCSDFHNAAYRVTISQEIDGQEILTVTEVTVCCRGLGKQRYCQHEHERIVPPVRTRGLGGFLIDG